MKLIGPLTAFSLANFRGSAFKYHTFSRSSFNSLINRRIFPQNQVVTTRYMSDAESAAAAAAAESDPALNPRAATFFDKIVSKEIPADLVHEDDLCMAFRDIAPQGPTHFLVIPKNKDGLNRLSNAREDQKGLLGHLLYTAQEVAGKLGLKENGFRVIINDGKNGAQSVYHLHIHVIGGEQMGWPPFPSK
jgi:histidine triad (HIT) family protein